MKSRASENAKKMSRWNVSSFVQTRSTWSLKNIDWICGTYDIGIRKLRTIDACQANEITLTYFTLYSLWTLKRSTQVLNRGNIIIWKNYFNNFLLSAKTSSERKDSTVLFWRVDTSEKLRYYRQCLSIIGDGATSFQRHNASIKGERETVVCTIHYSHLSTLGNRYLLNIMADWAKSVPKVACYT